MTTEFTREDQKIVNAFDKIMKNHSNKLISTYYKIVEICYEDLIFNVLDMNNTFNINIEDEDDECEMRSLIYANIDKIINDYHVYYDNVRLFGNEKELLALRKEKWLNTDLYKQMVKVITILQNNM